MRAIPYGSLPNDFRFFMTGRRVISEPRHHSLDHRVILLTHIRVPYYQWIVTIQGGSKMKGYFTNKNVLICTLMALLGLSITDIIMRMIVLKENAVNMNDYGAPLVTAVMSILLIIFALKGKGRLFYIVCGGWFGIFRYQPDLQRS